GHTPPIAGTAARQPGRADPARAPGPRMPLVAPEGEPLVPVPRAQELVAYRVGLRLVGRPGTGGVRCGLGDAGTAGGGQPARRGEREKDCPSGGPRSAPVRSHMPSPGMTTLSSDVGL